jgi:hypothetical protein
MKSGRSASAQATRSFTKPPIPNSCSLSVTLGSDFSLGGGVALNLELEVVVEREVLVGTGFLVLPAAGMTAVAAISTESADCWLELPHPVSSTAASAVGKRSDMAVVSSVEVPNTRNVIRCHHTPSVQDVLREGKPARIRRPLGHITNAWQVRPRILPAAPASSRLPIVGESVAAQTARLRDAPRRPSLLP